MPQQSASPSAPSDRRVGVRELRSNLTALLREAAQGQSIAITSHGKVVAELRPPPPEQRAPRKPGGMEGQIWMADDFDELPPDILAAMEGEDG
jgi:antitoxin (DNA-binding transcriptional repressor) of toxin-antitoxin stability system